MHHSMIFIRCLALLVCCAPLAAQNSAAVLFKGAPGGMGTLEVRDLNGGGTSLPFGTALLRILPLEVTGRTDLARAGLEEAWRHDDVPGASRLSLPGELGSLYHFELDVGVGARSFGYFTVDGSGQVLGRLQLPGSGVAGDQNPLLGRVSVARDGAALLCATTLAAGGNLLEVDLLSGTWVDRTPTLPAQNWLAQSLFLAPQWGLAVHRSGAQRFSRVSGAVSSAIDFGVSAPTWFSGEVALSQREKFAVTVAGASAFAADVYAIAPDGSSARVTSAPAWISRAGYLPEELDGPFLAISDDGQQCAWRTEGLAREAFLGRVPWQSAANSTQLTADANFIDTIDEVGQFAFRSDGQLRFSAGERGAVAGEIDKIDVFAARLPAGAATATLSNQTLSSGIASPPYLAPGRIQPEGALDVPGARGRLFADGDREELLLLAPLFGTPQVLLTQVKAFEASVRSGDQWLLALRRTGGSQPRQVLRWNANVPLALQILYSDDNTDELTRLSLRGNTGAFVDNQISGEHLWALDLSSGGLQLFSPRAFLFNSGPAITASGELACGLGNPALQTVFARWQPGTPPKRLGPTAGPGFVLRGL